MSKQEHFPSIASKAKGLRYHSTAANAVATTRKRHGVSDIFGQSLPSMVLLACEAAGIRQIAYRQENTGGYTADAYARTTGKVAVVTAQNGPAAARLVPPKRSKHPHRSSPIIQEVARDPMDRNAL